MVMERSFKQLYFMVVLLSIFAIVLTGCGGGGGGTGGGGGGVGTGGITPIENSTQATQAFSAGLHAGVRVSDQSNLLKNLTDLTDILKSLSNLAVQGAPEFKVHQVFKQDTGMQKAIKAAGKLSKMKAVKAPMLAIKKTKRMMTTVPISGTYSCPDGGSVSYSGQYDDQSGAFNLNLTYANCREYYAQLNGPMTMQGTIGSGQAQITMNLGGSQTAFEFLDFSDSYANPVSKMEFAGFTITETWTWTNSGGTVSATTNGQFSIFDYMSKEQYNMTFTNLKQDITYNETSTQFSENIKTNGGFSETWTNKGVQNSVAITYIDFVLNTTGTNTYSDQTVSGKIVTNFTPDSCFEGTFVFETVTPIHDDYSVDRTIAGHLKINDNTHIEWKSDGTIVVWLDSNRNGTMDSGEVAYQGDVYGLAQECDFTPYL